MNFKLRGCLGYIILVNVFIVSAFLGTGAGLIGWILPAVLIAVAFMFVQMVLDVLLLMMGIVEPIDGGYVE